MRIENEMLARFNDLRDVKMDSNSQETKLSKEFPPTIKITSENILIYNC